MRAWARGAVGLALLAVLVLGITQPTPILAADPSPTAAALPTARAPTCAERYPSEGPGGVDLQLGCVVSELVGFFGGLGPSDEPQRLTGYLLPIVAVALALAGLLVAAWTLHRRASRRIAPTMPVAWWSCPVCRSLNAAGRETCYRCGRAFDAAAIELRTDGEPLAPQSFGRRMDRP
jgi:hypothetical protein